MNRERLAQLYWTFFILGALATGVGAALPWAAAVKITMGAGGSFALIAAEARRRMEKVQK
ncbi:MAG: hypothetical protein V3V34_11740 [Kiloniellales bacterium]